MLVKISFNLLFWKYINVIVSLKINEEKISKIRNSLKQREYSVENIDIKQENIHFTIKNLEGEIYSAECKPIDLIDFDCIYKRRKDFRARHEYFAILKSLSHYNHLKTYDVYECAGFLIIIIEYFEGGISIKDSKLFKENEDNKEKLLTSILKPIFYVLDYFLYLRHRGLYHGNITLDNILVDEKGKVKICGLFSIKKSYFCAFPKKNDLLLNRLDEENCDADYEEDYDVKKLYKLIMILLCSCDINDFENNKLKNFIESLRKSIKISAFNLIEIRNHDVFDDAFSYAILDFRELENFYRIEDSASFQKTNRDNLIYTNEFSEYVINIKINSTYSNDFGIMNKIYDEFLEISCYSEGEFLIIIPCFLLKIIFESISLRIMILRDSTSYIIFNFYKEIDVIYNKRDNMFSYSDDEYLINMINNVFYVQKNGEIKILNSISSEENYHFKLCLILFNIFKSINYNSKESELECAEAYEKFIKFKEEIDIEENILNCKQLVYVLKLPYVFIDEIGSVEVDSEYYIYNLENEFEHEICEIKGEFYRINGENFSEEKIELTKSQKFKVERLKLKTLSDSHFTISFINQYK